MYPLFLFAAWLLGSSVAPPPTPKYSIDIRALQERLFPNPAVLSAECRTTKRIWACTVFAAERLSCSCEPDGTRWRVRANASFVPIMCMYLRHPAIIRHEQSHVDEVRQMLAEYLEELTSLEFTTEEACAAHAKRESEELAFVRRMNGFRQKSNQKCR